MPFCAPSRTDPPALLGRAGSARGATGAGAGSLLAQKQRGARFQLIRGGRNDNFSHSRFSAAFEGARLKPRGMSRKKTVKGKAAASGPPAGSPTGRRAGRTARSSPGIVPMTGVVHPSRPAVSSSGEFYDIAFKVRPVRPPPSRVSLLKPAAGSRCQPPVGSPGPSSPAEAAGSSFVACFYRVPVKSDISGL